MSATTNNNWYNLNTTRKYPLDDGCTGVDDNGQVLPATIISDIHFRLPKSEGVGVMISSVVVSDTLVSITFLAINHPIKYSVYDAPPAALSFSPLCAVNIVKPVIVGKPYQISSFVDGAAGWVVFGEGVNKKFNGRFSTPIQSAIIPKVCRYYDSFPVSSIGKVGSINVLTGLVQLVAGRDVSITKGQREIDGQTVDAIVFALKEDTTRNVKDEYRGPCSGRPESNTCNRESIQFLNTTGPDCRGNIDMVFEYPFVVAAYELGSESSVGYLPSNSISATETTNNYNVLVGGGISVDYPIGLIDACTRNDYLPNSQGDIPNQGSDYCNPSSEGNLDSIGGYFAYPGAVNISSAAYDPISLPANVSFDEQPTIFWQTAHGSFEFVDDDSPSEENGGFNYSSFSSISLVSVSLSYSSSTPYIDVSSYPIARALKSADLTGRNIYLWYNPGYSSTVGVRVKTDLKLLEQQTPANGGIVLNYRVNNDGNSDEYFVVELNRKNSTLNIKRFNGFNILTLASSDPFEISLDTWYRLVAETEVGTTASRTRVTGKVYSLPDNTLISTLVVESTMYLPATGKVGLVSTMSETIFSNFFMENI